MAPEPADNILAALDFTPDIPCGCALDCHNRFGNGPASWILELACPGCNIPDKFPVCGGCWGHIMRGVEFFECIQCKTKAKPMEFFYSINSLRKVK